MGLLDASSPKGENYSTLRDEYELNKEDGWTKLEVLILDLPATGTSTKALVIIFTYMTPYSCYNKS